jgi:deoxyribodipyrimidine photo-lyase
LTGFCVRLEAIDTNGLLPVADAGRAVPMAHGFRAHLQRTLRAQLRAWPAEKPLAALPRTARATIDPTIVARWRPADAASLSADAVAALPIDHGVAPVAMRGGTRPARARLAAFVERGLLRYGEHHNQPEQDATSRLSPWLHFGHLSVHDVFQAVMTSEKWTSRKLGSGARGARDGWWNVSASAEAFLDELVTWASDAAPVPRPPAPMSATCSSSLPWACTRGSDVPVSAEAAAAPLMKSRRFMDLS